ncbi:MAG: transposase [Sphingobacteriaceae bacterium]|nr:MAG: transposase [Sphingobacteriaceae bacterium]
MIKQRGHDSIVYLDETGFVGLAHRLNAYSKRGKKVYGSVQGSIKTRINLIVAKLGKKLLAPVLYPGSTHSTWFNQWLKEHLFKELKPGMTVIMDNAAFHKTAQTKKLFEDSPFHLLYLPPYSPDFNPIEQDFAILKKRRQFLPPQTSLDDLINLFGF